MVFQNFSSKNTSTLLNTNVILIPKMENPSSPDHFRPISLWNVSYKIISSILVNRLKPIIQRIVSLYQNALMPGSIILAQELIHLRKKPRTKKGVRPEVRFHQCL